MARTRKAQTSGLRLRGFYRVNIVEQDGRIVGDSGWLENKVVNEGVLKYLIDPLRTGTGVQLSRMALGTGTTPAATATSLNGEITDGGTASRITVVVGTASGSTAVSYAATWLSASGFVTASKTIQNIMIISNTTSGGTMFAGNTFASSVLNVNQDRTNTRWPSVDVPLAA